MLVLANPLIRAAINNIDRADFVQQDYLSEAYKDYALPIGHGQTISQPTTVAFMLEKLDPEPGQKVLDVGSGSGWTTALLAHIVGGKGKVLGLELIPDLVRLGQKNLSKYNFAHAKIEHAEAGTFGKPGLAPFDRILVSAAADDLPDKLVEQLKPGGIMVIPVRDAICRVEKTPHGAIKRTSYPGFAFVPLVG